MRTGYFAKLKTYTDAGYVPVSIALKTPDWYNGHIYKKLSPPWWLLVDFKNGSHKNDTEFYTRYFYDSVLDKLNAKNVIQELEARVKATRNKIILLCYEKPDAFCHRHLVSKWLRDNDIYCIECI